jgi:hypothetical protein
MKSQPIETHAPDGSGVQQLVAGSYFHDAWSIDAIEPNLDPLGQFLRVANNTPSWIDAAMNLCNRTVELPGIKDLGGFSDLNKSKDTSAYKPGDRVGIFTLISQSGTEVLLGITTSIWMLSYPYISKKQRNPLKPLLRSQPQSKSTTGSGGST